VGIANDEFTSLFFVLVQRLGLGPGDFETDPAGYRRLAAAFQAAENI
jgi:hypothetical protein